MQMRKVIWLIALMLLLSALAVPAATAKSQLEEQKQEQIRLFLNGEEIPSELSSFRVDGHTVIPLRIVAESFGAEVGWQPEGRIVTVTNEQVKLVMAIDQSEVSVNEDKMTLPVAPFLEDGNTMIPVRFVAEQLGLKVIWDDVTESVYLYRKEDKPDGDGENNESAKEPTQEQESADRGKQELGNEAEKAPTPTPDPEQTEHQENTNQDVSNDSSDSNQVHNERPVLSAIQVKDNGISILSTGAVKPNSFALGDPNRIVIDLPGLDLPDWMVSQNAGNDAVMNVDHPIISKVRYARFSSDPLTVRIVVELREKVPFTLVQGRPNEWNLQFVEKNQLVVVIDAGHGGSDPGAISYKGKFEKEFNLSLSNKIMQRFEDDSSVRIIMTRSKDEFISLEERVNIANSSGADLFISIHANSMTSKTVRGTETYYWRSESLKLAELIHSYVVDASGLPDREVRKGNFKVIRETTMPAVLLELGYLSNPDEEQTMYSDAFQNAVADAIAEAIRHYLVTNY